MLPENGRCWCQIELCRSDRYQKSLRNRMNELTSMYLLAIEDNQKHVTPVIPKQTEYKNIVMTGEKHRYRIVYFAITSPSGAGKMISPLQMEIEFRAHVLFRPCTTQ